MKKNFVLWSVTSWSLVDIYQRSARPLTCQQISTRIHSITSKNTKFFIITAVKISYIINFETVKTKQKNEETNDTRKKSAQLTFRGTIMEIGSHMPFVA
jgi:hypothetical protein